MKINETKETARFFIGRTEITRAEAEKQEALNLELLGEAERTGDVSFLLGARFITILN